MITLFTIISANRQIYSIMRLLILLLLFNNSYLMSQTLSTFDITQNDFFAKVNATSYGNIPIKYANSPILKLDLNNNGISDYVLSYSSFYGRIVILFDRNDFSTIPSYDEFLDVEGLHIAGGDGFGYVFEKGDFNGDGIDDLVVGNPTGSYATNTSDGFAAIIFGKTTFPLTGVKNLSDLVDVTLTFTGFSGNRDEFGGSLSALDFNGDGIDDIAIGAPAHFGGANSRGSAYIIFGRNNFPSVIEARNESNIVIEGSTAYDNIAMYLRKGNFNSDQYDDLIITSVYWPGPTALGKIWILFGGNNVPLYYQLNNQYSNLSGFSGTYTNDQMGFAEVGDFNGDNIDDLFISASKFDEPWFPETNNHGKVYGILGPISSGVDFGFIESYQDKLQFAVYPTDINVQNTYMYIGDHVGICISLFDINDDGLDDVLLGADGFSRWPPQGSQTNEGGAFIFLGRNDSKKNFLGEDLSVQFLADAETPFQNIEFGHSLSLFSDNLDKKYAAIADNAQFLIYFFDISGVTDVSEDQIVPHNNHLSVNYPNPFNSFTFIDLEIKMGDYTTLMIYDELGKKVATLLDEYKPAGNYKISFNAINLPSGVYFYRINTGTFSQVQKMILLK